MDSVDELKLCELLKALCIENPNDSRIAHAVAQSGQANRGVGRIQSLLLGPDFVGGIDQPVQVVCHLLERIEYL